MMPDTISTATTVVRTLHREDAVITASILNGD
jgi:hypothetical protein